MKESLAYVKKKAIDWLNIPIRMAPEIGLGFISHPFFNSKYAQDKDGIFLMKDEPERTAEVIQNMTDAINRQKEIHGVLCLLNKPYRIDFLVDLFSEEGIMNEKACGNELGQIWSMLENNDSTDEETREMMLNWLLAADKDVIMDKNDLKTYNNLPEQVTAYRGLQPGDPIKGFSWSLDLNTAEWFSKRFSDGGQVYSLTINKKDVIAYKNGRCEQEIIVNYKNISEPVLL